MKFSSIKFRAGAVAMAALAMLSTGASVGSAASERDLVLSGDQEYIAQFGRDRRARNSTFVVDAWVDRKSETYHPGDTLTLQVRVNKPAYITVLDIGTSGKIHVLFPNKYQRENRVGAYEVVQIPEPDSRFRIRVSGPSGAEVIKVFATDHPIDLFKLERLAQAGAFHDVPSDARAIGRDLEVEFDGRHKAGYGEVTKVIRIEGRPGAMHEPPHGPAGSDATPEELFKLGEAAFYGEREGSIHDAFDYFTRAAERGHVLAMVRLGQIHEDGVDGRPEILKAVSWYTKAANLGSTQAMVRLSRLYDEGRPDLPRSFADALSWLNKAAQGGDGLAMAHLARAFDQGRGVAVNPREAALHALGAVRAGTWSVQSDMMRFSQATREEMQRMLKEQGFYDGPVDGDFGPETRRALTEYARAVI